MPMRLTGDPDGIAALKALNAEHRDYLKFLITEAQSNSTHVATFKAPDGSAWELAVHLSTGTLEVRKPGAPAPVL